MVLSDGIYGNESLLNSIPTIEQFLCGQNHKYYWFRHTYK